MDIRGRLAEFRKQMEKEQMDLYYVPTNDFHGSEYEYAGGHDLRHGGQGG